EGVEGAEGAGRARGGFVPRKLESAPGGSGGAQTVAGVVIGEDERIPAAGARSEMGAGSMAAVMVQADDAGNGKPQMPRHVGQAHVLRNAELAARGVHEAEPGAPLANPLPQRPS